MTEQERRRDLTLGVAGLILVVGVLVALWWLLRDAEGDADQAAATIAELKVACEDPDSPVGDALREGGYCPKVEAVVEKETTPAVDVLDADERLEVSEIARRIIAEQPDIGRDDVYALVLDVFRRNPPEDGATGPAGPPPGERVVRSIVDDVYAANPPADGADGRPGAPGTDGTDGADGRGISAASINDAGELILTYTDGTTVNVGRVRGNDGAKGDTGDQGPPGPPGPACPDGYSREQRTIRSDEVPTGEQVVLCVAAAAPQG